jgi:hypothetical protein
MATRKNRTSTSRNSWRTRTRRPQQTRSNRGGRPWSSQEISFMRRYYRVNETKWVARQLGRTVYSVRYKASSMSIRKANPSVWKGNKGTARPTQARRQPNMKMRWARTTRRNFRQTQTRRTRRMGRR